MSMRVEPSERAFFLMLEFNYICIGLRGLVGLVVRGKEGDHCQAHSAANTA